MVVIGGDGGLTKFAFEHLISYELYIYIFIRHIRANLRNMNLRNWNASKYYIIRLFDFHVNTLYEIIGVHLYYKTFYGHPTGGLGPGFYRETVCLRYLNKSSAILWWLMKLAAYPHMIFVKEKRSFAV